MSAVFRKLSTVAGLGTGGAISIYGYDDWKNKELRKLKLLSQELGERGYLKLPSSVSGADKRVSWENILRPKMMKLWKEKYPEFDLDKQVWPEPESGKNYQMTLRDNRVPGLPHVFRNNYLVQATLACFIDPELRLVHYGDQTCFKLKALISPKWALTSLIFPSRTRSSDSGGETEEISLSGQWGSPPDGMYEFHGDDQSWHISNFPNKKFGKVGKALPWASHFDAGIENIFTKGIPNALISTSQAQAQTESETGSSKVTTTGKEDAERHMLRLALHQLGILFYSDTPGTLDPASGATGFYPGSHLVVNKGLKDLLAENSQVSWWSLGFALRQVFPAVDPQESSTSKTISQQCSKPQLVQPVLHEDEILLVLGTMVHSPMFATELMTPRDQPRVIQNCKVSADFCTTHKKGVSASGRSRRQKQQDDLLDHVSKDSQFYRTFAGRDQADSNSRALVDEYKGHLATSEAKAKAKAKKAKAKGKK